MKLLDTTFLIDLLRGRPETKKIINSNATLLTTQINLYEVIAGLFYKKTSATKILQAKELFENIRVLPFNDNGIIKSAEISGTLMRTGQTIGDADCLTAGIALSHGIKTVVTKNEKHFERIKELKIEKY